MLCEKILGNIQDYKKIDEVNDYKIDPIVLNHEELIKPHQKAKTKSGKQVAISLPLGDQLFYGAVLNADDNILTVVEMADEDILEIFPKNNFEWGKAAFNIGNMHHPAYLKDDSIVTPYDPAIERIFKALGIEYKKTVGKLDGERANVNQTQAHEHSHSHSHDHNDSHSHDHNDDHNDEHSNDDKNVIYHNQDTTGSHKHE